MFISFLDYSCHCLSPKWVPKCVCLCWDGVHSSFALSSWSKPWGPSGRNIGTDCGLLSPTLDQWGPRLQIDVWWLLSLDIFQGTTDDPRLGSGGNERLGLGTGPTLVWLWILHGLDPLKTNDSGVPANSSVFFLYGTCIDWGNARGVKQGNG